MRLRQMAPVGAVLVLGTMTASIHAVPPQDSAAGAVTFNKQVLPILQDNRRYVIITGGGAVLLRDMLLDRLATVGKTQGEDFLLVNHGLASVLNAVGALFAVLFLAAKKG